MPQKIVDKLMKNIVDNGEGPKKKFCNFIIFHKVWNFWGIGGFHLSTERNGCMMIGLRER